MKRVIALLIAVVFTMVSSVFGADKLAVAQPVAKGGLDAEHADMLWSMLETVVTSKGNGKYILVSRSALQQLMTEIGLTTSSDLMNLNSAQKAKLGQLETVKYLLISEIGKFGSKINCTMRVMDASTGVIDPMRTVNLRCQDLDELADRLEWGVEKMLADRKKLERSAVLTPVVAVAGAPEYLGREFSTMLEVNLLSSGVQLQNLKSVERILAKNGIGKLDECEPKMYSHIGTLLEVKNLLLSRIDRFELIQSQYYVAETGARGVYYTGVLSGSLTVINVKDGSKVGLIPFEIKLDFRYMDRRVTAAWTMEDYGKYMIRTTLETQIMPNLLNFAGAEKK